jgi:hypothetical protein
VSNPGNGELEVRVPALGGIRIAGRDLLLAVTLMILGAGAITMQVLTFRQWREDIAGDIQRAFALHGDAARQRAEILAVLRMQKCSDVLGAPLTTPRTPEPTP